MRFRSLISLLCLCLASSLLAEQKPKEIASNPITFPKTVYLEEIPSGTVLNFEFCFKVNSPCKLFLITYKYLDKKNEPLLYRRLVAHHMADIDRFITIFDEANKVRTCSSDLKKGDFCCITHPYSENAPSHDKLAFIECTAYFRSPTPPGIGTCTLKVPVKKFKCETKLVLPFSGLWWHLEGHDTFSHHRRIFYEQNTNYFASDFMKVDDKLSICKNAGAKNEDYYSYGEPVFAVADGVVVKVIDGIADNPIGGRAKGFNPKDGKMAGGNTVIINHQDAFFSYYAHFKNGTIKVKEKQSVKAGEILGLCGNSGNSDAPHIHFHLISKLAFSPLKAHGLPAIFGSFLLKSGDSWREVNNKSLLAGELIKPKKQ